MKITKDLMKKRYGKVSDEKESDWEKKKEKSNPKLELLEKMSKRLKSKKK
jgi:hypothetical protein